MEKTCDPSLALRLPLDEIDGAAGRSRDACGHRLTVTGASWRPGGHAFNGTSDHIACGSLSALEVTTGDFSVVVWGNLTDYTGGHRTALGGSLDAVHLQVRQNSGSIVLSKPSTANAPAAATVMPLRRWVMLAAVFDSHRATGNLAYYLDGRSDGVVTFNVDFAGLVNQVGAGNNGGTWFWAGRLGDIRLYRRRLAPGEVQAVYLATKWRYR
jgi:hypothetical protein